MDALHGGQRNAEGRALGIEQPSAREGLHAGDSHVVLFAELVQLNAARIDPGKRCIVALGEVVVEVVRRRHQVKGGIDAEEDHLDEARLRGALRNHRIVGGQPDVPDDALFMQLMDVLDEFRVHARVPVALQIHVVNHAQVDVAAADARQQILEGGLHILHVPGAHVLAVLPGRADVALHKPLVPARRNRLSDDVPGLRVGHPAIDDVDSLLVGVADQIDGVLHIVPLQPLPAEAHLADHEAGLAQSSVLHTSSCMNFAASMIPHA